MNALTNWEILAQPEWEIALDDSVPTDHVLTTERHDPDFYAMIPKLVQFTVTPYELALYTNYKQYIGQSKTTVCKKSAATLAKETSMSVRQINRARNSLEQKGFIRVKAQGKDKPPVVQIVDIWQANHAIFIQEPQPDVDAVREMVGSACESDLPKGLPVSPTPLPVSPTNKNNTRTNALSATAGRGRKSKSTVPLQYQSYAEQHPELSEDELKAKRDAAIQRDVDESNARLKRNEDEAGLYQVLFEEWDIKGGVRSRAGTLVRFLLCKPSKDDVRKDSAWADSLPDRPIMPDELRSFAHQWRKDNPKLKHLPTKPDVLSGYLNAYIANGHSMNGAKADPLAGREEIKVTTS